jgi:glyoxylase-like metal-dependent hydrolase (beta-lactamase superfamily II)
VTKTRKALLVLAVLLIAAVPLYLVLFTESTVPSTGRFAIDIAQVRALAEAMPGPKPTEVRFEAVGDMHVPSTGIVAGSGWSEATLTFFAYQLRFGDRTALIDTGMVQKTAEATLAASYDTPAFGRVSQAMAQAALIVVTHEHYDHLGGIATQPNLAALMPHLKLTREQLSVPAKMDPVVFPTAALEGYAPLVYDGATAIAPGVVLIKAPGHTPGSQLVYVKRADGAELLFLGDVAWHWRNVQDVRTRPRLATLVMGEDRDAVLLQLKELHRLAEAEPKLQLIPGHDKPWIDQLVAQGFLKPGFKLAAAP